ncbi:hypothetical protein QOT17_011060 [Balamuthia mandrillaris]
MHHRISDSYTSTAQGGNQRKEAEVETEAASRTFVRLFHNATGSWPEMQAAHRRGSGHYFCYIHCYSEKKSGKRPSSTPVKGTEAWKATGCTRPDLLEPARTEKIRLYPRSEQKKTLAKWFSAARWTYNKAVEFHHQLTCPKAKLRWGGTEAFARELDADPEFKAEGALEQPSILLFFWPTWKRRKNRVPKSPRSQPFLMRFVIRFSHLPALLRQYYDVWVLLGPLLKRAFVFVTGKQAGFLLRPGLDFYPNVSYANNIHSARVLVQNTLLK